MERYLYLALDVGAILIPLIAGFNRRLQFYRQWKHLFPGMLVTAIIFLIWDYHFTKMGVWGFNPRYITGLFIVNLPLEEILFFICIPYACVFTYAALEVLLKQPIKASIVKTVAVMLMACCLVLGTLYLENWYTSTTFFSLAIVLVLAYFALGNDALGRFFVTYFLVLTPFFLINGVLTGSWIEDQVVWYNNQEIIGIRMGTIPLEDTFYGMLLILMNVVFFERLKNR